MTRTILINADDFGWTDGHNKAVERAHCSGNLSRASLLSNGSAFSEAVELVQRLQDFRVGVHLTLNEGRPLLEARFLPNLTRKEGVFYDEIFSIARLWIAGRLFTEEAVAEWRTQIERQLHAGLKINHLDSHKHVHIIPPLLEAFISLAKEYGVSTVRLPLESWKITSLRRGPQGLVLWILALVARKSFVSAKLSFSDHFIGINYSGNMADDRLKHAVNSAQTGITEIMVHPAVITPAVVNLQRQYRWAARYRFADELKALCDL